MKYTGPKIFFIDLDGTLIDSKSSILVSKKNMEAINKIKKYSHLVVSTGRSFNDHKVEKITKELNSEFTICSSGAHIYENDILIKSNYINQITLKDLKDFAIANKVPFVIFTEDKEHLIVYNKFHEKIANMFFHKRLHVEHYKNSKFLNSQNVAKIAYLSWPFLMKKLLKKVEKNLTNINKYTANGNWVLEITDISVNKATANEFICNKLNIDIKDTIHIGDSMSDAATIGVMGKTIAMKNSDKKFKKIADYVGPKYKKGGVAQIIEAILKRTVS
ncbi:HAD-IIB family hydrolase [Mycoplasmopsis alligatoris]|uniref:HAD hydrolase, family IIB n=1 Tax=Mycoplasmopsis alligatoris A21JP2 TaxID=747682 RepID=D4XWD9_9BACT|nr:HAD-IIB family hydrolase [Mycoplasmopsis alligatoris]EFF41355.1 HAD hydrolase, family IIB [Mycoplasmopsis alligatoris A21JP2]